MRTAGLVFLWINRLTGLTQVVLGVLFWTGHALGSIPLHMTVGYVFVISLWALAWVAARSHGTGPPPIAVPLVWGLVVIAVGVTQTRILPGHWHWTIQLLHLLLGLAAMGQAQGLAIRAGLAARRGARPSRGMATGRLERPQGAR